MHMPTLADLVGDVVERLATKLPTPAMRTSTPSSCSSRSARLAVMRETPNSLTMSFSDGTRADVAHLPESILVRI
jgi:hypothetical protein